MICDEYQNTDAYGKYRSTNKNFRACVCNDIDIFDHVSLYIILRPQMRFYHSYANESNKF